MATIRYETLSGAMSSQWKNRRPGTAWRASAHAPRKPNAVATADESTATEIELTSASITRRFSKTRSYHCREKPLKGGVGRVPSWNENSTSTATGSRMKP